MAPPLIANADARRLFLARQGLADPPQRKLGRAGLLDLIDRLGFVQVDSINTVERAHHVILFARNQTYRRDDLARLLERERTLFENWTHDAAIIPTRFYPYWNRRFAGERERLIQRWRKWRRDGFEEVLDEVLERIRRDGPAMSRHLLDDNGGGSRGWWDWHPSKTALEFLWRTGALAVTRRDNFQKVYDLTQRVIPACHCRSTPSRDELVDWACAGALERLGIATPGEVAAFWDAVSLDEAKAWCVRQPDLVPVLVAPADGGKPRPAFARQATLDGLRDLPAPPARLRVLSPFDPLIRDRRRTLRLFGFDYRIEVFVPAALRRHGYYVLPLLEGARLIGRIDLAFRRRSGALAVNGLWLEPGIRLSRGRQRHLEAELERLRRFLGAERITAADSVIGCSSERAA